MAPLGKGARMLYSGVPGYLGGSEDAEGWLFLSRSWDNYIQEGEGHWCLEEGVGLFPKKLRRVQKRDGGREMDTPETGQRASKPFFPAYLGL